LLVATQAEEAANQSKKTTAKKGNDMNLEEPNHDLTDTIEKGSSQIKARWSSLERPIQIAIVAGAAIILIAFARYVIPAMIAALGIGFVLAILFVPYWRPTIIAFFRGHPNKFVIGLVNFFLGWTFIGWWVSLFWALSNPGNQSVIVNVTNTNTAGGAVIGGQAQPMVGHLPPQPMVGHLPPQPMAGHPPLQAVQQPVGGTGPRYQVGDVVNGHRFDGASWVPVDLPQPQTPPPPPPGGGCTSASISKT
jgi:hypothetical protein